MLSTLPNNCYEVLGVPPDSTPEQIKERYRHLARQLHPDVNPNDPAASRRFVRVTQAYKTLSDPQRRAEHDAQLQTANEKRQPPKEVKPNPQPAAAPAGDERRPIPVFAVRLQPRRKRRRGRGRRIGSYIRKQRAEMREILWMAGFGWCIIVSAWNLSRFWNGDIAAGRSLSLFLLWFVLPLLAGIVPCICAVQVLNAQDRADREQEEERVRKARPAGTESKENNDDIH